MKKIRFISIITILTLLFTANCFATESNQYKVTYKCDNIYSAAEVENLIETGKNTTGEFKIANNFNVEKNDDLNIESVGDNMQLLERRVMPDGTIEEDYIATSIYDVSPKEDSNSQPTISPNATNTDSTTSIRMALSSIFTKISNSAGILVKITDFQVYYTKLDPQALVTKISVYEDSYGHIYDSTATNLLFTYGTCQKYLGSKSSGITPNVVYNINNFSGKSALSNYYVAVTDGEAHAGTKANFTIKRNNAATTWTGTVRSHIFIFGESS